MGREKNYLVLLGKKCVLELVMYLNYIPSLRILIPLPKKMVEQASCFISFKNILFHSADFCS